MLYAIIWFINKENDTPYKLLSFLIIKTVHVMELDGLLQNHFYYG